MYVLWADAINERFNAYISISLTSFSWTNGVRDSYLILSLEYRKTNIFESTQLHNVSYINHVKILHSFSIYSSAKVSPFYIPFSSPMKLSKFKMSGQNFRYLKIISILLFGVVSIVAEPPELNIPSRNFAKPICKQYSEFNKDSYQFE